MERHIRPKYACPACDGAEGMPVVRLAPMPPQIIPKGIATPSLMAQVFTSKFVDALPFYRQTVNLDDQTPQRRTWGSFVVAIPSGRPWSLSTTRPDLALFPRSIWATSRAISRPTAISCIRLGETVGIIHVGCMAHIRRKFIDVQKASPKKILHGTAKEIQDLIGQIYKIERVIKDLSPKENYPIIHLQKKNNIATFICQRNHYFNIHPRDANYFGEQAGAHRLAQRD